MDEPDLGSGRDRATGFDGAFAVSSTQFNLAPHGESERVPGLFASGSTFAVLGVRAILGRTFTEADKDRPRRARWSGGGPQLRLLAAAIGGSATVLGQRLLDRAGSFTIVGVTPAGFFGVEVGRTFAAAVPFVRRR